ncbi:MAG: hypothetical protein E7368_04660 [Clostridiales bacterium]|nr:hypothetical protein [Clostridiales bacterium]
MKKNNAKKWLALSLVSVLGVSMFACNGTDNKDDNENLSVDSVGYAYMAIDINPTVEFVLKGEKVVSVDAVNDDAEVLVAEEEFVGMTAEEASETVVQIAEELGYLNEENADVKITVATDDETQTEELTEKVKEGAKRGSDIAKVNSEPRRGDCRKEKELKEENPELFKELNPAKVRMIEAIMRYDETMTFEIGATMSFEELADMLEDYVEEYKEIVGEELREEYKKAMAEKKEEKELAIAEKYGEEFKAQWEAYRAVREAYKALEKKAENAVIAEEDVNAIMQLLEIDSADVIFASGEVTVEIVDRYLDKHYECAISEETEEAVEDILDKYDEDEYVLTEEDLSVLQAVLGEVEIQVGITLEDVEEIVEDLEEALEELREEVRLDDEVREDIHKIQEEIREEMKGFKDEVHGEMKDRIEEAKSYFKGEKEERREQFGEEKRPCPPEEVENETDDEETDDEELDDEELVA